MDKSPVDIFLELVDSNHNVVAGESVDAEFSARKAIEINEFKLDGDSHESRASAKSEDDGEDDEGQGKGRGTTKGSKKSGPLCKFEVTKLIDKSSPLLMLAYLQAISSTGSALDSQYASATVTVRKSGGGQLKFLILKFGDVSVISYSLDVKSETPEETMVFKFMAVEMQYYPQKSDGTLDVMGNAHWDFYGAEDE
ncbi:MAG: type VI secretion system tube protein Hcp [Planctomycetia bacterium]|nr:type VI secretion system tube protein Hcp [Planctomycetia bacterium]